MRAKRAFKIRKRCWMRRVVLRATVFNLDKVIRGAQGDLEIHGHYDAVKVVVSYQRILNCEFVHVVLQHDGVLTTSYRGECKKKVLVDVFHVMKESNKGRLYLLKEEYLRRFVITVEKWMKDRTL